MEVSYTDNVDVWWSSHCFSDGSRLSDDNRSHAILCCFEPWEHWKGCCHCDWLLQRWYRTGIWWESGQLYDSLHRPVYKGCVSYSHFSLPISYIIQTALHGHWSLPLYMKTFASLYHIIFIKQMPGPSQILSCQPYHELWWWPFSRLHNLSMQNSFCWLWLSIYCHYRQDTFWSCVVTCQEWVFFVYNHSDVGDTISFMEKPIELRKDFCNLLLILGMLRDMVSLIQPSLSWIYPDPQLDRK